MIRASRSAMSSEIGKPRASGDDPAAYPRLVKALG